MEAGGLLHALMAAPPLPRRHVMREQSQRDIQFLLAESMRELGTAFGLWHDTPSGFVEDVLGETIWSRQREIIDAVPLHTRVAVPAGFGVGKTFVSARSVLHFVSVRPVGSALAVTTATRFRQVRYQLWPHIRKAVSRAGLPGTCDTVQYKIPSREGVEVVVAYGFTAPENDEAAMQGIHSPSLLLVVDEAGGISRIIGAGTNNLLTGDARMLAIGNPASDDPRSWFERLCEEGEDPSKAGSVTIAIPTTLSPAITGEVTPACRDCSPNHDGHTVAKHMPTREWVDRTLEEFGPDHPYVVAKVYAKFPRDSGSLALPISWVEAAMAAPEPEGPEFTRLCDLGLPGEMDPYAVRSGSWVRLGVDVAGSGGDSFVIHRMVGDMIHHRFDTAGPAIQDQVQVAETILEEILAAERLVARLSSTRPVRVKIDMNGIGHGAVGMLQRWAETGRHKAQIVGVMVSESPEHDYTDSPMRPRIKRDEAWLAHRQLVQPDPSTGFGKVRLRVSHKTFVQLVTPRLAIDAAGRAVIESKDSMRRRGVDSPDFADSVILCSYEPHPILTRKRRGLLTPG